MKQKIYIPHFGDSLGASSRFSESSSLKFHDFCKKIISSNYIILNVINVNVKYERKDGFRLYDLMYLAFRQYMVEFSEDFWNTYRKEDDDDYCNKIFNETELNWENLMNEKDVEHDLHYFVYDDETNIVTCGISH